MRGSNGYKAEERVKLMKHAMMTESSIYVGSVMHRRLRPRPHHFRYRAYWMLLDLDETGTRSSTTRLKPAAPCVRRETAHSGG
jgi:hypothetical protein